MPKSQPLTAAQAHLVADALPAAKAVAGRFAGRGVEPEDLRQEACLGLCQAAPNYRPGEHPGVPFAAFSRRYVIRRLNTAVSRRPTQRLKIEIEDPSSSVDLTRERAGHDVEECLADLGGVDELFLRARYGFDGPVLTAIQIASLYRISPRTVRARLELAREKLRERLESGGWQRPRSEKLRIAIA